MGKEVDNVFPGRGPSFCMCSLPTFTPKQLLLFKYNIDSYLVGISML